MCVTLKLTYPWYMIMFFFCFTGVLNLAESSNSGRVASLCELTARCVASHIPFELVEHVYPPVPEQLQLRIAFWSFPDNEEDIRLYSCLANSSADEFTKGEALFKSKAVKDPLQIGTIFIFYQLTLLLLLLYFLKFFKLL